MKRMVWLLLQIVIFNMALNAQVAGTVQESLILHVTPGTLKEHLTAEQLPIIRKLTLIGAINEFDFIVFRDCMPRLEELIIKDVEIDAIPDKAFCGSNLNSIVLPEKLQSIGDSAFYKLMDIRLTFTGRFPVLKKNVFLETRRTFSVDENNPYCKIGNNCVYSMDEKTLHIAPTLASGSVSDGTEIIDRYAFENSAIYHGDMVIPASVRLIREHAFDNMKAVIPVGLESRGFEFSCLALAPPSLDGDVFNNKNVGRFALFVLEASVEQYKLSSQWNEFESIRGIDSSQGVLDHKISFLTVSKSGGCVNVEASKSIHSVQVISFSGCVTYKEQASDRSFSSCTIPVPDKFIGLLQVIYQDKDREVVMLNF